MPLSIQGLFFAFKSYKPRRYGV